MESVNTCNVLSRAPRTNKAKTADLTFQAVGLAEPRGEGTFIFPNPPGMHSKRASRSDRMARRSMVAYVSSIRDLLDLLDLLDMY